MTRSSRWLWHRGAWTAGAFALALVLGAGTVQAQAVCGDGVVGGGGEACVGDCGNDDEVTVDEIITMTNIALGNDPVDDCLAGDSNNDQEITVDEILQAIGNALNGCPAAAAGEAGEEECDDGGLCVGGSNAGIECTADSQCDGAGVCEAGEKIGVGCVTDDECPDSRCVRCKTFGGDGCAANCTLETDVVVSFVPGQVQGVDIVDGTSGSKVTGDILTIPLPFVGSQTLTIGKERNGLIPVVSKAGNTNLPQIPISSLACACVRGIEFKSCGGTLFEPDGVTQSQECFSDPAISERPDCPENKPCAVVHGPGNSASGFIGCESFSPVNLSFDQDCNADFGGEPFDPFVTLSGEGGPGSGIVINGIAIGTVVGACQGDTPDYGPDGEFCTDDDPEDSRGTPQTLPTVTGQACSTVFNANDFPDAIIGPECATGAPFSCAALANGDASGSNLAGAFVGCDQETTGDISVKSNFVGE